MRVHAPLHGSGVCGSEFFLITVSALHFALPQCFEWKVAYNKRLKDVRLSNQQWQLPHNPELQPGIFQCMGMTLSTRLNYYASAFAAHVKQARKRLPPGDLALAWGVCLYIFMTSCRLPSLQRLAQRYRSDNFFAFLLVCPKPIYLGMIHNPLSTFGGTLVSPMDSWSFVLPKLDLLAKRVVLLRLSHEKHGSR